MNGKEFEQCISFLHNFIKILDQSKKIYDLIIKDKTDENFKAYEDFLIYYAESRKKANEEKPNSP